MTKYNTEQRKLLLAFLEQHHDEILSSLDIINYLANYNISKSAIYRNLSELESEGKIKRIPKPLEKTAYFQYVDSLDCKGKIHLSCIKCGKTSHISARTANSLINHVKKEDKFIVDTNETLIYGICEECLKK